MSPIYFTLPLSLLYLGWRIIFVTDWKGARWKRNIKILTSWYANTGLPHSGAHFDVIVKFVHQSETGFGSLCFFNCAIWNKTTTTTAVVMFCKRIWKFQVLVSQFTWAFILILLVGSHVHEQTTLQSQLFLVFVSVCKYELSYLSVFLLELFRGHFFFVFRLQILTNWHHS